MATQKSKPKKQVSDITPPGKSLPSPTSKSIIVTNHPLLRDPMVVAETSVPPPSDAASPAEAPTPAEVRAPSAAKKIIQPLSPIELVEPVTPSPPVAAVTLVSDNVKPPVSASLTRGEESTIPKLETETIKPDISDENVLAAPTKITTEPTAPTVKDQNTEPKDDTKQQATLEKLIEAKTYYLPINAVEARRTKRIIAIGVVLSLVLAAAWVDIALDAGLIHIQSIHPLTHFFSKP